ncbi:unnamed protein product [Malassezia sympodialis ATCC 42132]|uniref:uncharacterized protein n=1 Tax=Malassezia sympodialis (strain ATCC 42132) TaxID=1230383 RepID=UPI0002C296D3|nr:uncharacterized protein MSY001_2763 [Malassezia sympodialis ATCC 42132]CCV00058.1 unnamed protein product [Malassezia sympodialis ATCC 42132]|eukprot:XP_018741270.1 uncharacterized protein MSY001_2763 [Malassezia sympodialis ATCC 42132]
MTSTDGSRAAASTFTPPVGYRACGLDDMGSMSDKELWVIRVPEGVDPASLDGVTIPREALASEHGVLASVEVPGDDTYDVLVATQTTAERVNEGPSQLIEMAGPSDDRVRLDREFLRTPKSAGVASELVSVSALVPRKGSLRLGTFSLLTAAPIARRLYMARQAPRAAHPDAASTPRPRAQPWDRLKGTLYAPRKDTTEKKRKKDTDEPKKKKKQKQ